MQTYIYNIGDTDFMCCLNLHNDCEKLVLKGKVIDSQHRKHLKEIEQAISSKKIKEIDISNFDSQKSVLYSDEYEDDWYESDDEDFGVNILAKMIENRNYATTFVWCGDAILSSDLRIIVHHDPDKPVVFPETVEIIGKYAFADMENLWKITLPEHLKVIDDYAFSNCHNLHTINFPKEISKLGEYAFYECDLQNLDFPPGIDHVPEGCFAGNFLMEVHLPSTVKRICAFSFGPYMCDLWLPEGIEIIDVCAFGGIQFIHISSTVKTIDKEFYQDEDGCCKIPYVDVASDNPYFFDKAGTLYKVGETAPYLGQEFMPEQEESWLTQTSQFSYQNEYTFEELKKLYYSVEPVNSEQTMFLVWNGNERYNNIIDRYGNEYLNKKKVKDIIFSFDHFIIVNKTAVYSIDMKELLLYSAILEYDITGCDKEGRIYVRKGEPVDEFYKDIFPDQTPPECWCIDVKGNPLLKNRYNGLEPFDDDGFAPACMGKLWGMIDKDENVVIPYAYKSIGHFDSKGMALVAKGSKKGYVDRNGKMVIPCLYNSFYKKFNNDDYAYAMVYKGADAGEYFVRRDGENLGKFQPRSNNDKIYEKGFHIFFKGGKYGYCKQFARDFSGCIYQDIRLIDDYCIEVSADGVSYRQIRY